MINIFIKWLFLNLSITFVLVFSHKYIQNEWTDFAIGLLLFSWIYFICNIVSNITKFFEKKDKGAV